MSRDTRPLRPGFASESELGKSHGGVGSGVGDDSVDGIRLGCSMLSLVRPQGRQRGALAPMRCSLGYALRTRDDVGKCLAVEGPNACWKTAPSWRVAATDATSESVTSATELTGAAEARLNALLAVSSGDSNSTVELLAIGVEAEIEVDLVLEMRIDCEDGTSDESELLGPPSPNGSRQSR